MRFLIFTNSVDFSIIDEDDIGLFLYEPRSRTWQAVVTGFDHPVRLRCKMNAKTITGLGGQFVQVHQQYIINVRYLQKVVDNRCHFYPPLGGIDYVTVGRVFRKKLISSFARL